MGKINISANTNESLEGLTTKSDECIQTDDMRNDSEKEANQSNNIEMIDSFTQSDLRWDDENKHADTNLIMTKRNENKEQDTQYEDVIRQKQLQLNEIQTNYNKLFEIYTQSQLNFEKIQDDLKARLYTALVENKEKTTYVLIWLFCSQNLNLFSHIYTINIQVLFSIGV
ncbi:unnamed protein product [Trichobilharzia regenti]|nr:unnamed protein product [Trichobilharzia regenti]